MGSTQVGTYTRLDLYASVAGYDAAAKWWDVQWSLYFVETHGPNLSYNYDGVAGAVSMTQLGTAFSGSFVFDWRPGGLQSVLIASGVNRIYANPDGTPPAGFTVYGSNGATGSSGGGSGGSVSQAITLPTLKVLPGTPTSVVGTRISDTSIDLAWAQTSASNGQPTSNTIRRRINGGAWADVVTISGACR